MPEPDGTRAAVAELRNHCRSLGLTLPPSATTTLETYIRLLLHWNQRISLTGASTARELALAHILDSLHVAPLLLAGERVVDIGSGAGFPGIPLAIARPDCFFTLVEPRRKRANFLRHVARTTKLLNLQVEEARAEQLPPLLTTKFDVAVFRAVAKLASACLLTLPLLREGGRIIAMQGPNPEAELGRLPASLKVVATHPYRLPDPWGQRTLVVVRPR